MPGYQYDKNIDQFISNESDKLPIKRDSAVRHKIETLKFDKNEFIAISTLNADYLGVIAS